MRSSKLLQLWLLLGKNWKLQSRKKVVTVFEVILPILFCAILLPIRSLFKVTIYDEPRVFPKYSVDAFHEDLTRAMFLADGLPTNLSDRAFLLAYAPNTTSSNDIMALAAQSIQVSKSAQVPLNFTVEARGFPSETELLETLTVSQTVGFNKYLAGVIFSDEANNVFRDVKIRMNYELRTCRGNWLTSNVYPEYLAFGPRDGNNEEGPRPCYSTEGFLAIQKAIFIATAQTIDPSLATDSNFTSLSWQMQRYPYPPYIEDTFVYIIQFQLPLLLVLSLIFLSLQIPKEIVAEKEAKLKESMKMMGLSNWLHWLAWFIKYFILIFISVVIITFLISPPWRMPDSIRVFAYSDSSLVFVFLLLYAIATITFGFMVSVLFQTSNVAAGAGGILFFCSYIPYFFVSNAYDTMSFGSKLLTCLFHNNAMALGTYILGRYEVAGIGAKWSNFRLPATVDDDMSFSTIFGMLIFDAILYLLIMWYVEGVRPGAYGIPLPFYFPFMPSYWCGTSQASRRNSISITPEPPKDQDENSFFEVDPMGIHAGVSIQGLTKLYKKGRNPAVDRMNLKMYEGQITALLGHNGAGKTTTMFMLTGFIPPTGGTAIVNGYDIRKDIAGVRSNLGLCPQHDILFDTLTVSEHLAFFAKLKGCKGIDVDNQIDHYLTELDLEEKRHAFASTLSGGQKRKLSVGIALIGDSKVVILDEPTSGMDPSARRHMWEVLQHQRANRTMILSTHFMDEADNLGDRIAIMAEGVVKCCGSSLFLKKRYGAGYHMTMVKTAACDPERIKDVILRHVPDATLENNVAAELSYVLPHTQVSKFEGLFTELEENKVSLGISGYGASVTTMEEVFLKVADEAGPIDKAPKTSDANASNGLINKAVIEPTADEAVPTADEAGEENGEQQGMIDQPNNFHELKQIPSTGVLSETSTQIPVKNGIQNGNGVHHEKIEVAEIGTVVHDVPRNTGFALQGQQFKAMFIKRFVNTLRNKSVTISQLVLPIVFTIFACLIGVLIDNLNPVDKMVLDLSKFVGPETLVQRASNETNFLSSLADEFVNITSASAKTNLTAFISDEGVASIEKYTFTYIIASEFSESNTSNPVVTGLYNSQPFHAAPISMATVGNAVIRHFTGLKNASILFSNEQLPKALDSAESSTSISSFILSIFVMFGMAFLASSFVVFLIRERHTKVKHIQYISGVNPINFWVSTACWDMVNYTVPALCLVIVFAAFNIEGLYKGDHGGALIILLVLYGVAILPHMYLLQHAFETPATGYVMLTLYNVIIGIFPPIVVLVLASVEGTSNEKSALEWVFFFLFPHYCFSRGLTDLRDNYDQTKFCTVDLPETTKSSSNEDACSNLQLYGHPCCKDTCGEGVSGCIGWETNLLAWDSLGIGRPLVFLIISSIMSTLGILLLESGAVRRLFYFIRPKTYIVAEVRGPEEDADVTAETTRLQQADVKQLSKGTSILLNGITKYYNSFQAVESLYAEIPKEECFGLLGVNGAGKTTTFKMLTGDESISGGTAYLNGYNVRSQISDVRKSIGYCPQFDALIDQMTGEETLYMYARLRGIRSDHIEKVVDDLMVALTLTPHAKKQTQEYSGGNKRKLSTAIALIGGPPIVFLDEPTTGMDPAARRMLWNTLTQVRAAGKTLVLTSHSMEECEALCTRLAIMVNGRFRCLGSIQHLKTKYGEGYSLIARVGYPEDGSVPNLEPLKTFVNEKFPGSVLKDVHQNLLQYHITNSDLSWAYIFGTLERARVEYSIEDYSVSQTTLEQVFINFARAQIPPREEVNKGMCSSLGSICYCCTPEMVVRPPKVTTL